MDNKGKQPKGKRELREAIIENVNATKNAYSLHELYTISDILRRKYDDKEYITLTDKEFCISSILNNMLSCSDPKILSGIGMILSIQLSAKKKGGTV